MKLRPGLVVMGLHCAPAEARPLPCEISLTGDPGEVIASVSNSGRSLITWVVQRQPGFGKQTEHISRPGLMMDFGLSGQHTLTGPSAILVLITRYSDAQIGQAPPMSSLRVRATVGARTFQWPAASPQAGEAALAEHLRLRWPDHLEIDLLDSRGEVVASAAFDLSYRKAAAVLAREAQDRCAS